MKLVVDESRTASERNDVQSVSLHCSTASDVAELTGLVHVKRTLSATIEATTSFGATRADGTGSGTTTGGGVTSTGGTSTGGITTGSTGGITTGSTGGMTTG